MGYIPVCTAPDSDLWVTQFDGKVIENAGMLKMDFLGLKTLTIIKDAIENIHGRFGNPEIEKLTPGVINSEAGKIDPDLIAEQLEDEKTYQLFQKGETVGVFQFESPGMQKYLKQLKPTGIEDLIAMNALYRPGPMDFIPSFINRKHGRESVEYPHPFLEDLLKPSYGIMVYQEQIMQTAQIMGGYSLGQADLLRRAMGKKKMEEMKRQREIFRKGAAEKGVDAKKADEIFDVMERFAAYGFNRSHSAAYSIVAFQTAFLKAHYPAEYMAAVLTHNMSDIKKVNFFLQESNRMGIKTKLPDINESNVKFTVNKKGEIRFALSAIKGVGGAAVESLIAERNENGAFKTIFDLAERVNLRALNKKSFESLAKAGAFDGFGTPHRAQFFFPDEEGRQSNLEKILRFGNSFQKGMNSAQSSLFGAALMDDVPRPKLEECEEWSLMERLKNERETTGIYLSGHPLDDHRIAIRSFCNCTLEQITQRKNVELRVGCIVMAAEKRVSKNGKEYGRFTVEDFDSSYEIVMFGEDYVKFGNHFEVGRKLFLKGAYEPRWRNDDRYEFKVREVRLLETLMEESAGKLLLNIPISGVNDSLIGQIENICKTHPGTTQLGICVYDAPNNIQLDLYSKKFTVECSNELFQALDRLDNVRYKLN